MTKVSKTLGIRSEGWCYHRTVHYDPIAIVIADGEDTPGWLDRWVCADCGVPFIPGHVSNFVYSHWQDKRNGGWYLAPYEDYWVGVVEEDGRWAFAASWMSLWRGGSKGKCDTVEEAKAQVEQLMSEGLVHHPYWLGEAGEAEREKRLSDEEHQR